MSENLKTATFIVVACLLAGAAYITKPQRESVPPPDMVGKDLFPDFDDPNQAARLAILRYDEDLGQIHHFQIAKNPDSNLWYIPSHDDYPADAQEQMRSAALSLVGLQVLGLVTEDATEHELFGVVEPDRDKTKLGDAGVGTLVSFRDQKGKQLAELVIGKQVKGADEQRFVRIPGQDVVYAVAVDPTGLSTKFQDWIESDLLQLNSFDIAGLVMKDYSVVTTTAGPRLELRSTAAVDWESAANDWQLQELITYRREEAVPTELLPTEELNDQRLNDVKTALDDLKIVDVRRKPEGLGADLKADASFMDKAENRRDLQGLGFYASRTADGTYDLLSANGELHAEMNDGYEYVLRFGGVAGTSEDAAAGLNRYLLVTARVLADRFPMPELEPLPEEAGDNPLSLDGVAPGSGQAAAADDSATPEGNAKTDDQEEGIDERERRLAAEKERITRENQRKMDQWRETKETAEARVRELNARFADWYYIIAEDEYRELHLSRSEMIRDSDAAAEEGFGVDAFRQLETSGLENSDE